MNNATASLQSTVSFLLLTTLCSTISPSRMHTLSSGMAEKKVCCAVKGASAAQHNKFTKCFIVFLTGECIAERERFGFSDCAACRKCLKAAVLLLCLEHVRPNMQETLYKGCCIKFTHAAVQKALTL